MMNISNSDGHHIQVGRINHVPEENDKNRVLGGNGLCQVRPPAKALCHEKQKQPEFISISQSRNDLSCSFIKSKYSRSNIYSSSPKKNENLATSSKGNITDSIIINSTRERGRNNFDFKVVNDGRDKIENLSEDSNCFPDEFNLRTQVYIKPPSNSYAYHHRTDNFTYDSDSSEQNLRIHNQRHEYNSEITRRGSFMHTTDKSKPYTLQNVEENQNYLSIARNKNELEPYSIQVLSPQEEDFKNSNCINLKKLQLQAKAEQLRLAEEIVKKREEEAQAKTWQALQQQEALLMQKEQNLKNREILAQKKYDEAMKILEESKRFLEQKSPIDNSSVDSNLPVNKNSSKIAKTLILDKYPKFTDKISSKPLNMQSEKWPCDKTDKLNHDRVCYRITTKPPLKFCERKPPSKTKYSTLEMFEVKPSIEPSKILHTYSRKGPKKQFLESKFRPPQCFIDTEIKSDHDLHVQESSKNLKEHVLVNDCGTLTITQVPKFDQPIRPQSALPHLHSLSSKRKLEDNVLPSCSRSVKKCPSRLELDDSSSSCASDLSVSFIEKVEKLTSDFQFSSRLLGSPNISKKQFNTNMSDSETAHNYIIPSDEAVFEQNSENEDEIYSTECKEKLQIVSSVDSPNKHEYGKVTESLSPVTYDRNVINLDSGHNDENIEDIPKNKVVAINESKMVKCQGRMVNDEGIENEQRMLNHKSATNNNEEFSYQMTDSEKMSVVDSRNTVIGYQYEKFNTEVLTDTNPMTTVENVIFENGINSKSSKQDHKLKIEKNPTNMPCVDILTYSSNAVPLKQNEFCDAVQNKETDYSDNRDLISKGKENSNEVYVEDFNCFQNLTFANDSFNGGEILNKQLLECECGQADIKSVPLLTSYSNTVATTTSTIESESNSNIENSYATVQTQLINDSTLNFNYVNGDSMIQSSLSQNANSSSKVVCNDGNLLISDCKSGSEYNSQVGMLEIMSPSLENLSNGNLNVKSENNGPKHLLKSPEEEENVIISDICHTNIGVSYASSIIYTSPPPESTHIYTLNAPACATLITDRKYEELSVNESERLPNVEPTESPHNETGMIVSQETINCSQETINSPEVGEERTNDNTGPAKHESYKQELQNTEVNDSEYDQNESYEENNIPASVNDESKACSISLGLESFCLESSDIANVSLLNTSIESVKPEMSSSLVHSENSRSSNELNHLISKDDHENSSTTHETHCPSEIQSSEAKNLVESSSNVTSRTGRLIKRKDWWPEVLGESQKHSSEKDSISISNSNAEKYTKEPEKIKPKRKASSPKRGRLKGSNKKTPPKSREKNQSVDDNVCIWMKSAFPFSFQEEGSFECGKCEDVFDSLSKFKSHAFLRHSGLVRIKGESQEFDPQTCNQIIKMVFKIHKKLCCDKCKNIFRSILGFNYHRERCGINFRQRKKGTVYRKKKVKKMKGLCRENINYLENGRQKRKAARTCNDHIRSISKEIGDADDEVKDKDFENNSHGYVSNFSRISDINYKSPEYENFLETLKRDGESKCINSNCNYIINDMNELKTHLKSCQYSEYLLCKTCNMKVKECDLNLHLEEYHDDYSSDSSYDSCIEYKRGYKRYKPYRLSEKMTAEFRQNNYSDILFQDLVCIASDWIEVTESETNLYETNIKHSPLFKLHKNYSKSNVNEWDKIEYPNGKVMGSSAMLFCGGPIRSSVWCPVPDTMETSCQYLAVACLKDPDQSLRVNESEISKGLIQIWNCGTLNQPEVPMLDLCIAHEFGTVWSMEWCPSGIYEKDSGNNNLDRLGLLACAFSDGSIRIFLIPHPYQINSKAKVFKKNPELSLLHFNFKISKLQCVKVTWSSAKTHSLVAGTFTNGMVCIWDLSSKTSLLRSEEEGLAVLFPVNSIHAHNGVCSTVSFCPQTEGQHIVTGGNDRTIKFWDLMQPDHPLSVIKKGMVTDSLWFPHWAGSFFSFDDSYSLGKTSTLFRENGFYGGSQRTVIGSNASVWCIDGSDWYNAVAQIDEAGEVLIACQHSLICECVNEKYAYKKRIPLFSIRLERLKDEKLLILKDLYNLKLSTSPEENDDDDEEEQTTIDNGDTSCAVSKNFKDLPLTYASASEAYGIRILDEEYDDATEFSEEVISSKQYSENMEPGPLTLYPLMGGSSVSWNKNHGTRSWLFVGMNSGLGRIIRISFLDEQYSK